MNYLNNGSGPTNPLHPYEDDETEHGSESYDRNNDEIFDDSGASDDEDSQLDPQFLAERKKNKIKQTRKQIGVKKHARKVLEAASSTTAPLPHPSSAESRSIIDFVKHMMGCASRGFEHPYAPSAAELEIWKSWAPDREDQIQKHLDSVIQRKNPNNSAEKAFLISQELAKIKRADLRTEYYPAVSVNNPKISQATKDDCDNRFQSNGFPRITFEWTTPSLDNSDWNAATASILASCWKKWATTQRSYLKDSNVNAIKVIERWLTTARKEIKRKENQKNRLDKADQNPAAPSTTRKRNHKPERKKVAEYRFQTAVKVFPKYPKVWACFQDLETVSDYEENEDFHLPPRRINPTWRSPVFSELAHELDRATIQLAPRKSKSAISARLARETSREPTEEEAETELAPMKLPIEAYAQSFLNQLSANEKEQMGIKDLKSDYPLDAALDNIQKTTRPSNSMLE